MVSFVKETEMIYSKNSLFPTEKVLDFLVHPKASIPAPPSPHLSGFILDIYYSCKQKAN